MLIFYCESCGSKILDDDVESGTAVRSGDKVFCAKCVSSGKAPIQKPSSSAPHGSARSQKPAPRLAAPVTKNPLANPTVLLTIAGVIMLAAGIVLMLARQHPTDDRVPAIAVPTPPVNIEIAKNPAPTPETKTVSTPPPPPDSQAERQRQADLELAEMRTKHAAKVLEDLKQKPPDLPNLTQIKSVGEELKKLEESAANPGPEAQAAQAAWERQMLGESAAWTVLEPLEFSSLNGTVLTKGNKNSLLASVFPANETLTVTLATALQGITAIRLEVLPDPSLPGGGPGSSEGGNFVMTKFELSIAPKDDRKKSSPAAFSAAAADYSQDAMPVSGVIDKNPAPGWAIFPQPRRSHTAVFTLAAPIGFPGGTLLTFSLKHNSQWARHIIGRFRLSVTTGTNPGASVQNDLQSLLSVSAGDRIEEQKNRIAAYYRDQSPTHVKAMQLYYSLESARTYQRGLLELAGSYSATPSGVEAANILKEKKELLDALNSITQPKF